MAILMVAAACGKGPLPGEGTAYLVTDYESSDVPEKRGAQPRPSWPGTVSGKSWTAP